MSFESLFEDGIKSFQAKEFEKASEYFSQALALQPENPTLLVNMGLAQYELGKKIPSYVYFKKASLLSPDFPAARQGLEFLKTQVQVKEIPHQIEFYEQARSYLVKPVSAHVPLILTFATLGIFGYRLIRFLAERKKAYLSGEDKISFGFFNWLMAAFLVLTTTWALFFTYDRSIPRGLVALDSLSLRSAPSMNSPTVLELFGGLEVRILRTEQNWLQIQYPGSFSGWVQKESVVEL